MQLRSIMTTLVVGAVVAGCARPDALTTSTAVESREVASIAAEAGSSLRASTMFRKMSRLRLPNTQAIREARQVRPGKEWIEVGAGGGFSCGLRNNGSAWCWGDNQFGQLGNGTLVSSAIPVAVAGGLRFRSLAVAEWSACGLTQRREAYCWGWNQDGQIGAGAGLPEEVTTPAPVAGGLRFRQLTAGLSSICGLTADGVGYCWGDGFQGQLGNGSAVSSDVPTAIASGGVRFTQLSVSYFGGCALGDDSRAYCWGQGYPLGNGPRTEPQLNRPVLAAGGQLFAALDAGNVYACGRTATGAASCWGTNIGGELGSGNASSADSPAPVAGGLSFAQLDAHTHNNILAHTCGVTTAQVGYCWGSNFFGQLGAPGGAQCRSLGTNSVFYDCAFAPVAVSGGIAWQQIRTGRAHSCGVSVEGELYCWGENASGEIGDGSTERRDVPTLVVGP